MKFLICVVDATKFWKTKNALGEHGDLYVWGTNFGLNNKSNIELIPVPRGFLFPAGVTVVTRGRQASSVETNARRRPSSGEGMILQPTEDLQGKAYCLLFMKGMDGFPNGSPFFAGRKSRLDPKIVKFMLGPPPKDLVADKCICLPLSEGKAVPNLRHTMQVAWENGSIPVFREHLPPGELSAVCDINLELPTGAGTRLAAAKDVWEKLLSSCSEAPKSSLANFHKEMTALLPIEPKHRLLVRAYLLRFLAGNREVVHPAVLVPSR